MEDQDCKLKIFMHRLFFLNLSRTVDELGIDRSIIASELCLFLHELILFIYSYLTLELALWLKNLSFYILGD